jgi:tetratricopeptide (TPR) repeat protein
MAGNKVKVALVTATVPTVEEIDQFRLVANECEFSVVSAESICGYLAQTSRFEGLRCVALPDYDENPSYLPGLEKTLQGFDVVLLKERSGLCGYQTVKAKWQHKFRLGVWVDNIAPFPGEDIEEMRTIRNEVSNAADLFLVQTKAAKRTLQLEGVDTKRIFNLLPWVEKRLKRTKTNRIKSHQALGFAEGSFVISHIGPVEWEEGLVDLVSAVKMACDKNPGIRRQVKLVFCGYGSYADQIQALTKQLGVDDRSYHVAPSRDAFDTVLTASDCTYLNTTAGRDRVEGEPYRILSAMAHDVPLLAARTALTEEFCGKHRIDFCAGSVESLAAAIEKAYEAAALKNNIVRKNSSTIKQRFNDVRVRENMMNMITDLANREVYVGTDNVETLVREAESRVATGQYVEAIDVIEGLFNNHSLPGHQSSHLYRLIGDAFIKLGDQEGAKNAYMKSIEQDPYAARSFVGLGTVALLKESFDVAVIHFQKSVSLAPRDEMANFGLGLAFQGLNEAQEANDWVLKALEINPDNEAALFTANQLAYTMNSFADAERVIEVFVNRNPNNANMMLALGGLRFKSGKINEAITILQQITAANPEDERALAMLNEIRKTVSKGAITSNG